MAASNCREYMEEYYLDHKNYPNPEAIWFAASNYGRSQSVNQHTHDGSEASAQICPTCKGLGDLIRNDGHGGSMDCYTCNGTGKLRHA
jgi:hypothetical protein